MVATGVPTFYVTGVTRPGKIPTERAGIEPWVCRSRRGCPTHLANKVVPTTTDSQRRLKVSRKHPLTTVRGSEVTHQPLNWNPQEQRRGRQSRKTWRCPFTELQTAGTRPGGGGGGGGHLRRWHTIKYTGMGGSEKFWFY